MGIYVYMYVTNDVLVSLDSKTIASLLLLTITKECVDKLQILQDSIARSIAKTHISTHRAHVALA